MTSSTKSEVVLLACGDILLADFYFNIGLGLGSFIDKFGEEKLFSGVRSVFQKGDLIVGNLESPIAKSSIHTGFHKKEFLASPSVTSTLKKEGFAVMSIANNHISQHGYKAFSETKEALSRSGIKVVGEIHEERLNQNLELIEISSQKFGFLAFSLVEDKFTASPWFYANNPKRSDLLDQISNNRKLCDYLILMLHWGDEFVGHPSPEQVSLAHDLVDAGCDLIIGSHSHIFQGIEQYKGKVIAYSLGNFIFSMPWKPTRATGVLEVRFQENGQLTHFVQPLWIDDDFIPVVPEGKLKVYVEDRIDKANRELKSSESNQSDYLRKVKRGLMLYRWATRVSFLKNIFKMPMNISLQLMKEFINRRIRK